LSANPQDRGRYLLGLLLLGLVSGFLTCCTVPLFISSVGLMGSPLAGPLFGLAISLSLWLHKILNSIWKLLGIIVASTLANFAAHCVGNFDYTASLIAGGFVGGAILFPACWFLLVVHQNWPRFFLGFLICPLAGTSLAVLGWALAPSFGAILWHILNLLHLDESTAKTAQESNYAAFCALYVVWQSGMAVLLGVFLPWQSEEFGSSGKGHSYWEEPF